MTRASNWFYNTNICFRRPCFVNHDHRAMQKQILAVEGGLPAQEVEVIVNAWNRKIIPWWLLPRQGVSGAIMRKAGTGVFRAIIHVADIGRL